MKKVVLSLSVLALFSCGQQTPSAEPTQGEWITGTDEEQLEKIEDHFQGFGKAMWEVSYRYKELYSAGKNQNWGYAEHHVEEMEEAIELGLERRPKHAEAAEHFLNVALPNMAKAIEAKDQDVFFENFEQMRVSCNACHVMREHAFIKVRTPKDYYSVVGEEESKNED